MGNIKPIVVNYYFYAKKTEWFIANNLSQDNDEVIWNYQDILVENNLNCDIFLYKFGRSKEGAYSESVGLALVDLYTSLKQSGQFHKLFDD